MILAPTPREREGWYALWLLAQGWTASAAAEALDRDPHTILGEEEQAELRAAVQELPVAVGTGLANWDWKVMHQSVSERYGLSLYRSSIRVGCQAICLVGYATRPAAPKVCPGGPQP